MPDRIVYYVGRYIHFLLGLCIRKKCYLLKGPIYVNVCFLIFQIMRKLLGTHMGHSALYTMCRLLQESTFQRDVHLLRGAVFFVNMGLWGVNSLPKLECTPTSVLPSFYQVCKIMKFQIQESYLLN